MYKVHKTLLCGASSVFKASFTGNFSAANTNRVELLEDDPDTFDMLIQGLYEGTIWLVHAHEYSRIKMFDYESPDEDTIDPDCEHLDEN